MCTLSLVKLGLIERRASDVDAREIHIQPTAKAKTMKDDLNSASGEVTKRLKTLLGSNEFDDVVGKLRGISSALK